MKSHIEEIRALSVGWYDGIGNKITDIALNTALDFLTRYQYNIESSRIYPTESGGILIEFEKCNWDYSIDISSTGILEICGIEIDGTKDLEPTIFLIDEFIDKILDTVVVQYDPIEDDYYIVSELFKDAGWNPGDTVEWKEQDGVFILTKIVDKL